MSSGLYFFVTALGSVPRGTPHRGAGHSRYPYDGE
jgi:hypothetical protein